MSNTSRQWISLLLGLVLLLQSMLGMAAIAIDADDTIAVPEAMVTVEAPPCHGGADPVQGEPEPCPCCDQLDCSDMASCLGASAALNHIPSGVAFTRGQPQVLATDAAPLSMRLTPLLRPPIPRSA